MRLALLLALPVPLALVVACSSSSTTAAPVDPVDSGAPVEDAAPVVVDAGPDVDNGAPSDVYPAPHPKEPQVQSYGGPTMANPRIVPIVFKGDTYVTQIAELSQKVGASDYWKAATAEYGVGAATSIAPIVVDAAAPTATTDDEIQTWLGSMLDGTHADFGAPDENSIYTIFYPTTTVVTIPQWGQSCKGFGGYHYETTVGSKKVVYAVMPRCAGFFGLSALDAMTTGASHEWIEAVTDPHDVSDPAYSIPDNDHLVYALFPLSEVGDMCTFDAEANIRVPELGNYLVQRTWSNAAAAAHHHPCVPAANPGEVYFNSVPVLTEKAYISFQGAGSYPTKGVKIPVGQEKTIELDLFSDGPTGGAWTVDAVDVSSYYRKPQQLDFSFDRREGQNGEKLHMTIKSIAKGDNGGAEFIVVSTLGKKQNMWMGFVQQ